MVAKVTTKTVTKRAFCTNCLKAQSACICDTITTIKNVHRLTILQDPSEEKKALGTARILKLSLSNVQLTVGIKFNEHDFDLHNSYLLFPGEDAIEAKNLSSSVSFNNDSQFILLDGSWKKAYKLLMINPFLQRLPKVSISVDTKSNYRLRKSPREDGLSTVEAAYHLLSQIEGNLDGRGEGRDEFNNEKFTPLLKSFEFMIDYQISQIPADVYQKNYLDKSKD